MLPVALAARYPNGVWVSADVDVDASGRVLGVKPHLSDYYRYSIFGYWPDDSAISQAQIVKVKRDLAGPLGRFVISWAKTATYGPMTQSLSSKRNCVPHETVYLDLSFYPPDSGVTAQPPIFDGVDFDELTYKGGPCDSSEKAKMHYGESQYYYAPIDSNVIASVKLIFAGKVGGAAVAVVVLECGGPVWADEARVYRVHGATATYLGTVGTWSPGMTNPEPTVMGDWIQVAFAGSLLYVDAWVFDNRCDTRDWIVSTYSLRNEKLVRLQRQPHHRRATPRACEPKGHPN